MSGLPGTKSTVSLSQLLVTYPDGLNLIPVTQVREKEKIDYHKLYSNLHMHIMA